MLTFTMSSTKAISPSTATCQRPGISSRFMPPNMNSQIVPRTISVHSALLVKTNGLSCRNEPENRLDHELVHRVDFAFGGHLLPYSCSPRALLVALFEIRMTFQTPTAKPRNSITNISHGLVPNQRSSSQPTIPPPSGQPTS